MLLKSFSFPQFSNVGLEDILPALTHSPHLSRLVPVLIPCLSSLQRRALFPFMIYLSQPQVLW